MKMITITEALAIAADSGLRVTRATVIAWTRKYGIGRKFEEGETSPFYIEKDSFLTIIRAKKEGDMEALKTITKWCKNNK